MCAPLMSTLETANKIKHLANITFGYFFGFLSHHRNLDLLTLWFDRFQIHFFSYFFLAYSCRALGVCV